MSIYLTIQREDGRLLKCFKDYPFSFTESCERWKWFNINDVTISSEATMYCPSPRKWLEFVANWAIERGLTGTVRWTEDTFDDIDNYEKAFLASLGLPKEIPLSLDNPLDWHSDIMPAIVKVS